MKLLRVAVLWLAVLSVLSGCPKPVPPADAGTPEVDAGTNAQLCQAQWQVLCQAWSTCATTAPYFPTQFASLEECVTKGTENCTVFSDAAVAAGGWTGTLAEQHQKFAGCTALLTTLPACDVVNTYVFGNNVRADPECQLPTGTYPSGTPCFMNQQCLSGYCRVQNGCGVCADLSGMTGSCQGSMDCKPGLGCNNQVCAPWLGADAGCNAASLCAPDLACLSGHCSPRLPAGATCNSNAKNPCALGYCNKGKCEDFIIGATAGELCGVDVATGHVTGCTYGSTCLFVTQAAQGVCVQRVGPGDRCFFDQSFQGSQCSAFSQCVNGTCTSPVPDPSCGQDGGATPPRRDGGVLPPADGGALESPTQAQLTLLCDALYGCPRYQPLADAWFGSRAACEGTLSPAFMLGNYDPFGRATPSDVTGCNTALAALSACERADGLVAGGPLPTACQPPPGARPPGAPCMAGGGECGAGDRCDQGLLTQACGVCTALEADGGLCISADDCLPGLGCANGHCVPTVGLAAACSAASPCAKGLLCILGSCAPPGDVDAGCNPRNNECAPPLVCNSLTSTCELLRIVDASDGGTPGPDGGVEGAPCGYHDGGLYECPLGFACKLTDLTNYTGGCDVTVGPGEACAWTGGLYGRGQCRFPSNCVNGVCTIGDQTFCQ